MAFDPVPRESGSLADAFTAHAEHVGALLRALTLLVRLAAWGTLFWIASAYPGLLPAVHGLVAADFGTWLVARGLRWHSEPHLRTLAELAACGGALAFWTGGGALPEQLADRGVFGLAFLAGSAVKTLPAVWLRLHGEE